MIRIKPKVSVKTFSGASINVPKSIDIPTPIKNKPSSSPLNGSMSLSSACRYSELANRTPARNAPIAIDNPASSSNNPNPNTRNSATALKISRKPERATKRRTGRETYWPKRTTATIAPTIFAMDSASSAPEGVPPFAANNGIIATSGIAAMS
ncbi:hypothetical protein D3C76_1342880 [compost metagenome]